MKKRLLPLLLSLCLALSIPVSALAAEDFDQGALSGVTAASDGALLVTDTFNKVVWRVGEDAVTRYAGAISVPGLSGEPAAVYHDDVSNKAYFMEPWGITPFLDGYAVSDAGANVLRYIAGGRVYTLSGSGKAGSADGTDRASSFNRPTGLCTDADGQLYVADTGNGAIRRIDKTGRVTTVTRGLLEPTGVCWHDGALYVAETGRSRIVRVANGQAAVFAGVSTAAEDADEYYGGYVDGTAAVARFDHPQGVAAGTDGTIYVADTGNSAVRGIGGGLVYTLERGSSSALMPASPRGVFVRNDTLYVTDQFAGSILPLSIAKRSFDDLTPGAWYEDAVNTAIRQGIAGGTSSTSFEPNSPMTRAMFVTMLSRMHRLADGTAIIDGDAAFPDVPGNEWYSAAARWAADAGIVGGINGSYRPGATIDREQAVTMLYRYAAAQGLDVSASPGALEAFDDAPDTSDWALDAMRWACDKGLLGGADGQLTPKAPATRAQALKVLVGFIDAYAL